MRRPIALAALGTGSVAAIAETTAVTTDALAEWPDLLGYSAPLVVGRALLVTAVFGVLYGSYLLSIRILMRSANKRRAYNTRNLRRLGFGFVGTVATLEWRPKTGFDSSFRPASSASRLPSSGRMASVIESESTIRKATSSVSTFS